MHAVLLAWFQPSDGFIFVALQDSIVIGVGCLLLLNLHFIMYENEDTCLPASPELSQQKMKLTVTVRRLKGTQYIIIVSSTLSSYVFHVRLLLILI